MKTPESSDIWNNVSWMPTPNRVCLILDKDYPPIELTTSIHVCAFDGDSLLMIKHESRGWDIPGGHIEAGESLEQAVCRELQEEASAKMESPQIFGRLCCKLLGDRPEGYAYPFPTSYIALVVSKVTHLLNFTGDHETTHRRLFIPAQVRKLHWYRQHKDIYEMALSASKVN